jgi:hypothetical protein
MLILIKLAEGVSKRISCRQTHPLRVRTPEAQWGEIIGVVGISNSSLTNQRERSTSPTDM